MDNPVEEIKKRIDIVNFIGNYLSLKKSGRNFKALCPFHQEKTPSFIISPERQIWHCFGACQEGGDVIKFLMKWENITFFEALKELADKLGIKLKKINFEDKVWQKKEKLFNINRLAAEFYHYLLVKHELGKKAIDYLKRRKINEKIIDSFSLGYSPSSWNSLLKFLKKKGFEEEEIYEAGLLVRNEKGHYYDRFRKRLIFPLKDHRENVLGFSGRIFDQEGEAKYINTPETPIYRKRETLFGLNLTKDAIKTKNKAIIVEGEFDMISCYQNGVENVVAVKGSAVTKEQLMILKRYTNQIILSLDADLAGEETTKRAIIDAENLEFNIFVITLNFAKDPDEAMKKDPLAFKKLIKKPTPIYDFIIDTTVKKHGVNDVFSKKNCVEEIIPYLVNVKNPIVYDHYLNRLASILEVEKKSIEILIQKEKKRQKKHPVYLSKDKKEKDRYHLLETYILSLIFQNENPLKKYDEFFTLLEKDDFSFPSYLKLIYSLIDFKNVYERELKDTNFHQKFPQFLPKELIPTYDQILLFDISIFSEKIDQKESDKILYQFKKLALKKRIKEKTKNMDFEETKRLTQRLAEIEKKLLTLSN